MGFPMNRSADLDAPLPYPATERQAVSETRFGATVHDPYRWLEAEVRTAPKVRAWVDAQAALTADYLARLPHRDDIRARLEAVFDFERFSAPHKQAGRYFYLYNSGLQDQSVLMVQDGLDGAPRELLDPNAWASDGATALGEWAVSEDGRRLAYTQQEGGSDWRTIKVLDVDTGASHTDVLRWARFTGLVWAKDGSGFFYARYPAPAEGGEHQSSTGQHMVYFHALGSDQSADRLIFSIPDRVDLIHSFRLTADGRFLVVTTPQMADPKVRVTLIDLREPDLSPRALVPTWENSYALAGSQGDTLYFVTDKQAPNRALVALDVHGQSAPATIIPESADILTGAALVGGQLMAIYLVDAKSEVRFFDLSGRERSRLELPTLGSLTAFEGKPDDTEAFYAFESFALPPSVYRLDLATGASSVFKQPKTAFDASNYAVRQVFYSSKDGARVPMFIAHRKDLDLSRPQPTLLNAYGGFGISRLPQFSGAWLTWMQMGGVYALANIRGGGEYGPAWHDGGRLLNKQNVFADFIAAAEHLIAEKVTTAQQLAIQGGSNGGLLVGAVANQRPDLFAAVLAQVGVMDMLRFNQFTVGHYWMSDYGDPAEEQHFHNLLSFSPYHNVRSDRPYPAILTTTADTDDRVVPAHSFKYAAALQAAAIGDKPHLIRIETRAGHGLGKPLSKTIEEVADLWAFAGYFTNLTTRQSLPKAV